MDGFVNVKKKNLCFLLLHNPVFSEVDNTSAIDEHEHLDLLIGARLLDACGQFGIGSDGVDLVLYVLAFEYFLGYAESTEKILRVQIESTSTATNITIET
jgi:hypothetical protein